MIDKTNKEAIFNTIADILEKEFECPRAKLVPEAKIGEDLDLDSIDAVDLIVRLQKMTQIKVNPEAFMQIRTLQDITDVVYDLLNPKE